MTRRTVEGMSDPELRRRVMCLGGYIDTDGAVCGLSLAAQRQLEDYLFQKQEAEGEYARVHEHDDEREELP